jgi:CRP-like cAMP-binding protein
VLADRGQESLPILLEVADDLARQGSLERALVALRRADAIEPGHPAVKERFVALSLAMKVLRTRADLAQRAAVDRDKTDPCWLPLPEGAGPGPNPDEILAIDPGLLAFVRAVGDETGSAGHHALSGALFSDLQRYLFRRVAEGLERRAVSAGDIVFSEGDSDDSVFLVASGSVRVLVLGGHGRPLEIRRIEKGDFFGEVAALSGRPRSATVVAAVDCELLEVERWALARLVEARPAAKAILEEAFQARSDSEEEAAVRSIPRSASPERAAIVLKAQFGDAEWSPRVRLHLARLMLDAGQEEDALAVLASVAEELARGGHAEQGIEILKKVEQFCHTAVEGVPGRRKDAPGGTPASRAHTEAAFREWVLTVLRDTDSLASNLALHLTAIKR